MCNSFIRSSLALGPFLAVLGLGAVAHASEPESIPTQLRNPPLDDDPNGPCSLCRVNSVKAAEQAESGSATLEFYFDDDGGDLSGAIELTVLLYSGEFHTLVIEDVFLPRQELTVLELAPVLGWDWNEDVDHLWVEPIPAGPTG